MEQKNKKPPSAAEEEDPLQQIAGGPGAVEMAFKETVQDYFRGLNEHLVALNTFRDSQRKDVSSLVTPEELKAYQDQHRAIVSLIVEISKLKKEWSTAVNKMTASDFAGLLTPTKTTNQFWLQHTRFMDRCEQHTMASCKLRGIKLNTDRSVLIQNGDQRLDAKSDILQKEDANLQDLVIHVGSYKDRMYMGADKK